MRTKLLLCVAAALAVGIASSMAQTTYSQNVVGYVNIAIPAGGYQPVGNSLVNGSDANQTNMDLNTCFNAGLISDNNNTTPGNNPAFGSNTVAYVWNGSTFNPWYYFNATDANTWNSSPTAGFYDLNGDFANFQIQSGQAVFLQNSVHSPAALTLTLTGNVLQGTNQLNNIVAGYNFLSLAQPISTNPVTQPYGLPLGLRSFAYAGNENGGVPETLYSDAIYVWNGSTYNAWFYFNSSDANSWNGTPTAGFYDPSGDLLGTPGFSAPLVSQGFFVYHAGAAVPWPNIFAVQ